jgi:hypothetical protein
MNLTRQSRRRTRAGSATATISFGFPDESQVVSTAPARAAIDSIDGTT